jgi:serine protease Do
VQLTFPVVGDHGRVIGKRVFQGKVIRYCPNNDLALLRILGDDSRSCVRLASEGPELDDNLFILASPYGIDGFASLTRTLLSFKNRDDEGKLYEQIQGGVMLGSSGGGVFDSRGQLVGIVQKLYHPTGLISFAAPVERIRSWAAEMNCAWAFDTSVPVSYDDILIEAKKIPEALPLSLEYWLFLFGQGK